jgi:hypothetical protein
MVGAKRVIQAIVPRRYCAQALDEVAGSASGEPFEEGDRSVAPCT